MDILVKSGMKKAHQATKGSEDRLDIFIVILLCLKRQPTNINISEV